MGRYIIRRLIQAVFVLIVISAITFFLFIIVSVMWVWPMVLRKIEERQKIIAFLKSTSAQ